MKDAMKQLQDLKAMVRDASGKGFERGLALEKLADVEDALNLIPGLVRRLSEALLYVEYEKAYEGALDHAGIKKRLDHVRAFYSRFETAHSYVPLASIEMMETRLLIEQVTGKAWRDVAAELIQRNNYQELKA